MDRARQLSMAKELDQHGVYGSGLSGSRATIEICLLDSGVAVAHGAKALPGWLAFDSGRSSSVFRASIESEPSLFLPPLSHFVAALLP